MDMDKIGLLTIHDTLNFGSLLQTVALYKAVERLGCNITLIDYKNDAISKRESTYKLKDCKNLKDFYKAIFHHGFLEKKHQSIWKFIEENMSVSPLFNKDSIKESNKLFDTFLVGSDIVWGMNITGCDFNYMLDFAESNKKKIAFSSSVGEQWPKFYNEKIKSLLNTFDFISVREQISAQWLDELLEKEIGTTCDPTMLWNREFWSQYNDKRLAPNGKYILAYFRTDNKSTVRDASAYGKKRHIPVYYINYNHAEPNVKNIHPVSVEQWISLFANADTIFTASYHGLLFSIYFNKPFFWYNRSNKARMESLSKELNIENREGTENNILQNADIDFEQLNKILAQKRENSWNQLKLLFQHKEEENCP